MISDKASLFLCAFIVLGFFIAGVLEVLDNYFVIGVLILAFLIVVLNLFFTKGDLEEEVLSNTDSE